MMDSENSRQDHVSLQDQYCSPNHIHHKCLQKGDVRREYSVCWAYPCPQVVSRDALPSAGRDSPTTALRGKLPRPSSLPDQLLATLNSPGGKRQVDEASGNKQSGKWKCWRKKLISRQPRLRQDGLQPCYQVSDLFVWTPYEGDRFNADWIWVNNLVIRCKTSSIWLIFTTQILPWIHAPPDPERTLWKQLQVKAHKREPNQKT